MMADDWLEHVLNDEVGCQASLLTATSTPVAVLDVHRSQHNGISRLYETFGNAGADTMERTLSPDDYQRTWYRQNPPLPKAKWSQRNNNNYQQTALLTTLHYFSNNNKLFLKNYYLKSKRSVEKPKNEGPAAYVFPADDPRPGSQADLLRTIQAQGSEVHRATAPFTVTVRRKKSSRSVGVAWPTPSPIRLDRLRKPATEVRSFPAAVTSCAWISHTVASRTRFSITSIGGQRSTDGSLR